MVRGAVTADVFPTLEARDFFAEGSAGSVLQKYPLLSVNVVLPRRGTSVVAVGISDAPPPPRRPSRSGQPERGPGETVRFIAGTSPEVVST